MAENEAPAPPAGWYPTPEGGQRYWDGHQWTDLPAPSPGVGSATPQSTTHRERAATGRRRTGVIAAVIAVTLLLAGGGTAIALKLNADAEQAAADQEAAASKKAAEDKKRADAREREVQEAQKRADEVERERRADAIEDIEKSVEKMAKDHVSDDFIEGPIIDVGCVPVDGGSTDDLTETTTVFQCFVANEKHKDGTMSGHYYNATMNWNTGSYTYGYGQP
ncbi:DUF2510 domain-containing protein [Microbacterium sp. MC2]